MSQDGEKKQKLTIQDPVDQATLQKLAEVQGRRMALGEELLDLEQERVRIIVQARQLDDQKGKIFGRIVVERGLPEGHPIEIDGQTGKVTLLAPLTANGATANAEAPPAPPPVA